MMIAFTHAMSLLGFDKASLLYDASQLQHYYFAVMLLFAAVQKVEVAF